MNDQELQAATDALEFPHVTEESIKAKIVSTVYHRWPGSTVTSCRITMSNGFSVLGESACVDERNYNQEIGESYAFKNAFQQLWKLEGYLLAEESVIDFFREMIVRLYAEAGRVIPDQLVINDEIPALVEGIRAAGGVKQ